MVTTGEKLMTAAELAAMPDDGMRHELVKGVLRTMAPSSGEHGAIAANIAFYVMQHIRASNLGRAFIADAGFRLTSNPDTVRAPDFAVVKQDQQGSLENLKG
ncbi:MAG: Uma2 family endonuclease, partial [Dehalococcoidia bacterium]|nr:Uma2 family endonuclease [Dehalococcoidia bacterium]